MITSEPCDRIAVAREVEREFNIEFVDVPGTGTFKKIAEALVDARIALRRASGDRENELIDGSLVLLDDAQKLIIKRVEGSVELIKQAQSCIRQLRRS